MQNLKMLMSHLTENEASDSDEAVMNDVFGCKLLQSFANNLNVDAIDSTDRIKLSLELIVSIVKL